ncbi:MAG: protein phosphatase 2C domain-containing protein [Actinomycetota bacterium]|nr:protein phosphatase 2C domain-containing protein [Actinomycetota bacterium]
MPKPQDPAREPSPRPKDGGTRTEATQGGIPKPTYRSVLLLGSDHTDLGEVTIEAITPNLAIGISCGRFPKGYAHIDPNEDAVFAATDDTTTVLVVADGHHGFDAAREIILTIADTTPSVINTDADGIVRHLTAAAIEAVSHTIPNLDPPRNTSRAALTICVIRGSTLATSTIGDTACLIATKRRVQRIGTTSPFLSPDTDPGTVHIDIVELPAKSIVFVATDGVTDFAKPLDRTMRSAAQQEPHSSIDMLMAASFAGGAGDNIAIATARPSP